MDIQVGRLGAVGENIADLTHKMLLINREVIRVTGDGTRTRTTTWKNSRSTSAISRRLLELLFCRNFYDNAIHQLYDSGSRKGSSEESTLYEAGGRDAEYGGGYDVDWGGWRSLPIFRYRLDMGEWSQQTKPVA